MRQTIIILSYLLLACCGFNPATAKNTITQDKVLYDNEASCVWTGEDWDCDANTDPESAKYHCQWVYIKAKYICIFNENKMQIDEELIWSDEQGLQICRQPDESTPEPVSEPVSEPAQATQPETVSPPEPEPASELPAFEDFMAECLMRNITVKSCVQRYLKRWSNF